MVTLEEILQIVQTGALLGGILGFLFEYRRHYKEQGYATYLQSSIAYVQLERLMMQNDDLKEIYFYSPVYKSLDPSKRKIWHWYYMLFMLLEIVYNAHRKGWMGEDEWDGWDRWMREMVQKAYGFRETWDDTKELYSARFRDYVDSLVMVSS